MARFVVLLAGVIVLTCLWWVFRTNDPEPKPGETTADRIMEFCTDRANKGSPLCAVDDPTNERQVEDAVEKVIERATEQPRIIERETVREQSDDDDDDPRVEVNVPRQTNPPAPRPTRTTQPAPRPTSRPLVPEIPEVPDVPTPPDLGLPLLP
jgi:hypothetical protein